MQLALAIERSDHVGDARRQAVRLAKTAGLGDDELDAVALIATELATNLVKHTPGGELLLQEGPLGPAGEHVFELLAVDSGPGIADLPRALDDGWSTTGTLGGGLGAVRRRAHEFDVFSRPGTGTVVLARFGRQAPRRGAAPPEGPAFEVGAVCVPVAGETVCGDAWALRHTPAGALLLVADGLGHGPAAAAAAAAALASLAAAAPGEAPRQILERAHVALAPTRGAAVTVVRLDPAAARLGHAGIGNVAGSVLAGDTVHGMASLPGTVGKEMRQPREFEHALPPDAVLVLHTDGLESRWQTGLAPGLLARHPAIVAARLYRDARRGRDDVTVVVVRMRGPGGG